MRLCPSEHCTDPLPELSCHLRLAGPKRSEDAQHVFAADLIHAPITQDWVGMLRHRTSPVRRRFRVPPARPVRFEGLHRSLAENRNLGLALVRERITASACQPSILECLVACLGECHERKPAQTDIAALTLDGESLNPRLRSAGRHA